MPEVSAWRKYVLLRGVVFLTPLRTTKNMSTRAPAIRMRDTVPIAPPVRDFMSVMLFADGRLRTYGDRMPLWYYYYVAIREEWIMDEKKGWSCDGALLALHKRTRNRCNWKPMKSLDVNKGTNLGWAFNSCDDAETCLRIVGMLIDAEKRNKLGVCEGYYLGD